MDGRGNVVCGDKFGCGDLDLFEADTSHSLTDGLLQFEPVGHRPAEMLQPVHCARDSFQTVTQCPITRPPRSHSTTPALHPRCAHAYGLSGLLTAGSVPPRQATQTCGP